MEKDRGTPSPRSSRSRKLPSLGATQKSVDVRTGLDSSDEAPTRDVASSNLENLQEKAGVAYISENFIKRITKEENLMLVTTLHITLGKDLNKKIKYIENLDNLKRLLQLKLNDHMIEKIEKLDHLTHLRELHLAKNKITKIEGLDCLVRLQVLNLSGNLIEHLPPGVFKKLKELQAFHVAHNQLTSLVEITRLRPLPDLISLSVEGNPLAQLQHSRQFVIFQLRTLESLDRKQISEDERNDADERFAQEEVRRLEAEVSHQQKDYELLLEENLQAINKIEQLNRLHSDQKLQIIEDVKKIKELQRELEAKEELLKSKTAELSKACEKQFKLEQELAFYKLDAKFKHLGTLPVPEGVEFGDGEDDESPYIGKARFKPNNFVMESNTLSGEQESAVYLNPMSSRHVEGYNKQNKLLQQEIHDALMLDLQGKEKAIKQAEEDLEQLNDHLNKRKTQLQDAGDKLSLIQQAIDDQAHLLGEEERKLIEALADKTNYIRKLQQVAKDLEERIKILNDDIAQRADETDKLRVTFQSTSPDDLAYPHLQTKLAARERQLEELIGEYSKLKQDYDKAQARLQEEMAALKTLETQLQATRKTHGDQDQLKDELKNIIDELNDNLNRLKQQVSQQARQITQLQQEKDALGQRLREMNQQNSNNKLLKDNVEKLEQQLKLNEDALDKERRSGEMLRHRMSDLETQTSQGAALEPALTEGKRKLQEAEAEIARLQNALNRAKQQMQDDRHTVEERLRKEQEKVDKALQAARNAGEKERQSKDLRAKVDALTAANTSLSERLKEAEAELGNFENLLDKEEVLERLNTLKDDIDRNRKGVRQPISDQDDLGKALADLHQKYLDLVRDLEKHWLDKERNNKKADGELEFLNAKLQNSESALKQANDRSSQLAKEKEDRDSRLKKMAAELKKLENKLRKQEQLEDELEGAKSAHAGELGRLKDQVEMLNDQLRRAREGIHDELSSAREPLQAKIRELEKDMQKLEKKFSKAKAENEKLQATVSDLEANRRDLEDKVAELMDKLREAWLQAEKNDKKAWQRGVLESKVKALGDELQRTRQQLKNLRSEAADKLQAEKGKAANKIEILEDEIDALKNRVRRLQDKAEDELNRVKDVGARKVQHLEDGLITLRDQLEEERARRDEELRKAHVKEAALQDRLRENNIQLQRSAQKRQAQELKLRNLQQQIDELGKSLKEAETRTVKEQIGKELVALRAEQRQAAAQAAAARQLADAERQVATLQSLLDAKDRHLQDQIKHGVQNASDLAAQRSEISNLASALAAQNTELGRLKEDLAELSRVHVTPPYFHAPDHSLSALANEVQALRSALMHKQQQVESLIQSLSSHPPMPVSTSSLTAAPLPTQMYLPTVVPATAQVTFSGGDAEGVSTLPGPVTTHGAASPQSSYPGQVVHHHHFAKSGVQGKKNSKLLLPANSPTISPLVAGSTTVPAFPETSVHHHFYDEAAGQEGGKQQAKKRTKKRQQEEEVLLCNVPEHDWMEYEMGRLQGLLASSIKTKKTQSQRDSIRIELKDLETEVEDSLKRRATARQTQQHSLDATLAKFQDHLLTLVDHKSRLSS